MKNSRMHHFLVLLVSVLALSAFSACSAVRSVTKSIANTDWEDRITPQLVVTEAQQVNASAKIPDEQSTRYTLIAFFKPY